MLFIGTYSEYNLSASSLSPFPYPTSPSSPLTTHPRTLKNDITLATIWRHHASKIARFGKPWHSPSPLWGNTLLLEYCHAPLYMNFLWLHSCYSGRVWEFVTNTVWLMKPKTFMENIVQLCSEVLFVFSASLWGSPSMTFSLTRQIWRSCLSSYRTEQSRKLILGLDVLWGNTGWSANLIPWLLKLIMLMPLE